jgi:hypothetical protein
VLFSVFSDPIAASIQAFVALSLRLARRVPSRNGKSIHFVAAGEVDPTTSDDVRVPFACSGHSFVRPAAWVNDCAGVAIVPVQALVAPTTDHPHNRIVCPISSCNPGRALTVLANGPSRNYGGRTCGSNFISRNCAAPVTKNKICPLDGAVSGSRLTSHGIGNVCGGHRCGDAAEIVAVT